MTATSTFLLTRTVEDPETGCFEWQGAITSTTGHGKVKIDGRAVDTHRAMWILVNGPIGEGMVVCHSCDNRRCIRLSHLFLGTQSENMRDASRKGRLPANYPVGEASPNAKLTEADVLEIYRLATTTTMRQIDIAARFGIRRQGVSGIKLRQDWRHLLSQFDPKEDAA
jgi:hypothetical protein